MLRRIIAIALGLCACGMAGAQALPTAARLADVQVGGTFSLAKPDYTSTLWKGLGFYADADLVHNLGIELDFHQVSGAGPVLYERTYEIGPRYVRHKGRFAPYVKGMYGRGVFNFAGTNANGQQVAVANLAYNLFTGGGGLDMEARPGLNIRLFDYEYQDWHSFPPRGLTPSVISFGVAYHFHGDVTKNGLAK